MGTMELLLQFLQSGGREPIQLTQQVQSHRALSAAGPVFHLDRQTQSFAHAGKALNPLSSPL